MEHKHLRFGEGFRVVLGDERSQAAQMTLASGATEGDPDIRHKGADQWLFVVRGESEAIVENERVELREAALLLIGRGETHEIRNTGSEPSGMLNVYIPPAYTEDGRELPAAMS